MTPVNDEGLAFAGVARLAQLVPTSPQHAAGMRTDPPPSVPSATVRDREVSPRELVALYLERIAQLDPVLNAFRVVLADQAIAEAAQIERRLAAGRCCRWRACRLRSKTTPMWRVFRRCAAPLSTRAR